MKQFLFLIFCTLSAAFVSCKEETDGAADFRFVQPEVTDVTQTTANVSSRALFTLNDYPGLVKGFAYGPADEAAESYRTLTVADFERNAISARLTGLVPGTRYRVCAYVELGASRIMSDGAEFATLAGGDVPVLEIVSETTLSVPAAGGRQTIRYEVLNPAAGVDVTAAGDVTWLTSFDNAEYGVISFEVGTNEGAARSGVVTLSYTGADDRTVVVNQASAGEPAPDEPVFGSPSHSGVAADRATVTCSFSYDGSEHISKVWFAYKASGGSEREASVSASAGEKSTTLTGLSASTTYTYRLCAEIGGQSYSSATASFTTSATSGGGTGAGLTKHSGWPELVPEEEGNSDYYYAYHMCPDFKIDGRAARNYTVCFSAEHHCPVWVAAPRHDCYEGSANRTNAYRQDPDIPSNIQYDSKETGGGCNKGHMLGSAERTRSTSINRQVFYYSNIAPQYSSGFNTGGGGWNILEDWIDKKVCADTTYLVIGTYFEKYTDRYGNSASPKRISFGGRNDVSCPTMFYIAVLRTKSGRTGKSVLDCSADELMCAAFVRCHNNNLKGKQVSAKDMYSIRELEELTGHTFFSNVPNAPKDTYKASDWGL